MFLFQSMQRCSTNSTKGVGARQRQFGSRYSLHPSSLLEFGSCKEKTQRTIRKTKEEKVKLFTFLCIPLSFLFCTYFTKSPELSSIFMLAPNPVQRSKL